jgi:hypothetical protein
MGCLSSMLWLTGDDQGADQACADAGGAEHNQLEHKVAQGEDVADQGEVVQPEARCEEG